MAVYFDTRVSFDNTEFSELVCIEPDPHGGGLRLIVPADGTGIHRTVVALTPGQAGLLLTQFKKVAEENRERVS